MCEPWSLAMAARRDRVWLGSAGVDAADVNEGSRATPASTGSVRADVLRLLGKFASMLAARWRPAGRPATGRSNPLESVLIDQGPYGPGWHYLVYAGQAKQESSIARVLKSRLV